MTLDAGGTAPDPEPPPTEGAGFTAAIDLSAVHAQLEPLPAEQRIAWAVETFGDQVMLLASMQKTSIVLMHMFHRLGLRNEVLFIDTGYHFVETLQLRDEVMRRFGLNMVSLYPSLTIEDQEARYGKKLFNFVDGQPECCYLRKEAPLVRHLERKARPVTVGGLRRGEGGKRAAIQILSRDPRTQGFALSPIFDWRGEDVEAYIRQHDLPVHALHAQGFPSIGCYPCTTAVQPGEDPRAGRWRHLRQAGFADGPRYCGVNYSDGGGI
jgi:phosphoadenosine phosphosulfate reductase